MNRGMKMRYCRRVAGLCGGFSGGAGGIGERQGGIGKRNYSGAADENAGGGQNGGYPRRAG